MDLAGWVGAAATAASTVSFAPQAWKVLRTGETAAISVRSYSVTVTAFACWLAYGLLLGQWPIIVSNIVCLAFAGFILTMAMLPRRRRRAVAALVGGRDLGQPDAAQNKA
ncbi:SemiSWEET family sugar transporter [Stella sp.]|uniref:SemiSWEET family sugar transporter n=1 Tax=Stella sp. TaxID=2912054 RepID=UPI0035AF2EA0